MLIGATLEKTEIPYWEPKLGNLNMWFRVFPNTDGLIPVLSDDRYDYLRRTQPKDKRIVFVSSKLYSKYRGGGHGTFAEGLAICRARIIELVRDGFTVYYVEHHEPEGDMTPAQYKSNFNTVYAMKATLPDDVIKKVFIGHALTRQWNEDPTKGNFDYSIYDTGTGDFFGVDMYGNSWELTYLPAVEFLKTVKAYKYNASDTRPRCFPELGYIGMPFDSDGRQRAQWFADLYNEVFRWNRETTGWDFLGFIWWNTEGTSGSSVPGVGTKRWFQLNRKHTSSTGNYAILDPAPAVDIWKRMAQFEIERASTPAPPPPTVDVAALVAAARAEGFAAGAADKEDAVMEARASGYAAGFSANKDEVVRVAYREGRQSALTENEAAVVAAREQGHSEGVESMRDDVINADELGYQRGVEEKQAFATERVVAALEEATVRFNADLEVAKIAEYARGKSEIDATKVTEGRAAYRQEVLDRLTGALPPL